MVTEIGKNIIHFDQLPSTNAYAAELLSENRPVEGTIITTDNQFSGKGQLNNSWESAAHKNLNFSAILYPSFLKVGDQFTFNKAISIAVFRSVEAYTSETVSIKWPNDIYVNSNKIGGILIQNQIQGQYISSSIVGIGVNLNQEVFTSNAPNPISLYQLLGQYVDLTAFKNTLCDNLTQQYHSLRLGAHQQLNEVYHQHLYQKDKLCTYRIHDKQEVNGTIIGVNNYGLLKVLIEGTVHEYSLKEIKYLSAKALYS